MLGVAIYAWTNGNFSKLTTAYDPDGKGCGLDYPKFPYVYFVSPRVDVERSSFRVYGLLYAFLNVQNKMIRYSNASQTALWRAAAQDQTVITLKRSKFMILHLVHKHQYSCKHTLPSNFINSTKYTCPCYQWIRQSLYWIAQWLVFDSNCYSYRHRYCTSVDVCHSLHSWMLCLHRFGHLCC